MATGWARSTCYWLASTRGALGFHSPQIHSHPFISIASPHHLCFLRSAAQSSKPGSKSSTRVSSPEDVHHVLLTSLLLFTAAYALGAPQSTRTTSVAAGRQTQSSSSTSLPFASTGFSPNARTQGQAQVPIPQQAANEQPDPAVQVILPSLLYSINFCLKCDWFL